MAGGCKTAILKLPQWCMFFFINDMCGRKSQVHTVFKSIKGLSFIWFNMHSVDRLCSTRKFFKLNKLTCTVPNLYVGYETSDRVKDFFKPRQAGKQPYLVSE